MALQCMKMIVSDVLKSLAECWDSFLDTCYTHVSILEDKIYEQPADESRAPELWTNSSLWLKVEKLIWIHSDVVKEVQVHLKDLTADSEDEGGKWIESAKGDFDRLASLVQEDLVKPTANLADLVCTLKRFMWLSI